MTEPGRASRSARRPGRPAAGSRILAHGLVASFALAFTAGLVVEEQQDLLAEAAAVAAANPPPRPAPPPPVQHVVIERVITRYEVDGERSGASRRSVSALSDASVPPPPPVDEGGGGGGGGRGGGGGGGGGGGSNSGGS